MNEEHFAGLLLEEINRARAGEPCILIVNVQHDDDCPQLRGGLCQCSPDTSVGRVKDQESMTQRWQRTARTPPDSLS